MMTKHLEQMERVQEQMGDLASKSNKLKEENDQLRQAKQELALTDTTLNGAFCRSKWG